MTKLNSLQAAKVSGGAIIVVWGGAFIAGAIAGYVGKKISKALSSTKTK